MFLPALWRSPQTVGAVCPSSRALARAMLTGHNLRQAGLVVELGPGTGAFTRVILEALGPTTRFFALEVDAGAVRHLHRVLPHVEVFHDSAERLDEYVVRSGRPQVDAIVSGLPWAVLPEDLQRRIMTQVAGCLRPGGGFSTFAYQHARHSTAGRRYWRLLSTLFAQVTVSPTVWWNLPPAVVYHGVK